MAPVTHCVDDVRNDIKYSDLKKVQKVSVTEIEATETIMTTKGAGIICSFPAQPKSGLPRTKKIAKQFECEYPTVDPNVTRVQEPLPFPSNLRDVIAWTDVFVDRIAQMSAVREKEIDGFKTINAEQLRKIEFLTKAVRETLDQRDAQQLRADKLESSVKRAEATSKRLREVIQKMEGEHAIEKQQHAQEIAELTGLLHEAQEHDTKDHDALARLEKLLKQKTHDISELKKKLTAKEEELAGKKQALKAAEDRAEKAEKDFKIEQGKKNALERERDEAIRASNDAKERINELTASLTAVSVDLTSAREALEKSEANRKKAEEEAAAELKSVQAKTAADIAELQEGIANLDAKVTTLVNERDAKIKDLDLANENIRNANIELETTKSKLVTLNDQLAASNTTLTTLKSDLDKASKAAKEAHQGQTGAEGNLKFLLKRLEIAEKTCKEAQDKQKEAEDQAIQVMKNTIEQLEGHEAIHGHDSGKCQEEDLSKQLTDTKAQLEEARRKLAPVKENSRINITSVEYGGMEYTEHSHPEILHELYRISKLPNPTFTVTNKFFGGDPWPHETKSCSITYQIDGAAAVYHVFARETKPITFKGLEKR